mmetsp:Transcript_23574/g.58508  ORF Transcript_23574/g.58508 Transcript_23574/m.58508 type:complete len:182 (-) Transcript_23574:357-902(-)
MLARGEAKRPAFNEPAPPEGADAEDLLLPDTTTTTASPQELVRLVQTVQEARLQVMEVFISRFQDLVTAGRAAEYPALVERFKPKFQACQTSLGRISDALGPHQVVAALVKRVEAEESKRLDIQLELQVLEQHLSLLGLDDPDQPEMKEQVRTKRAALKTCSESIYELLEELRCEAADIEA